MRITDDYAEKTFSSKALNKVLKKLNYDPAKGEVD